MGSASYTRVRTRARRRAGLLALGVVAAGGLVVPGTVGAAAVSTDTSQGLYTFIAADGEANTLTINADATNYTFTDSVPISDSNSACTQLNANSLQCPRTQGTTAMNRIRAELAFPALFMPFDSAPNTFRYDGPPPPGTATEPGLRVGTGLTNTNDDISGSSGNDFIQAFGGSDIVAGEGGNDEITAHSDASGTFSGGDGNDDIRSTGGSDDTIAGGEGDDDLFGTTGADKLFGEGGADTLYNLGDTGGLVGDLLDGGAGNDELVEDPGDSIDCPFTVADTNIGGPGEDTVYDDCGEQDVFKLKDGERDKWHCGAFTGKAELDPSDVLVAPKLACLRGPDTTIRRGPRVQTSKHTAKFKFRSDNRQADFECKLDKKKFDGCKSPEKYKNLKDGKHVFQARALAGDLVGKPANYRWKVTDTPR